MGESLGFQSGYMEMVRPDTSRRNYLGRIKSQWVLGAQLEGG